MTKNLMTVITQAPVRCGAGGSVPLFVNTRSIPTSIYSSQATKAGSPHLPPPIKTNPSPVSQRKHTLRRRSPLLYLFWSPLLSSGGHCESECENDIPNGEGIFLTRTRICLESSEKKGEWDKTGICAFQRGQIFS